MHLLGLEPGQTLTDHRDSAWIAGCRHCRREFTDACERAGFTPRIAYTSDDVIVRLSGRRRRGAAESSRSVGLNW